MKVYKISREGLDKWIKHWTESYDVFGPVEKNENGMTDWAEVKGLDEISTAPGTTKQPIKTFYLPQPETLFTFTSRGGEPDSDVLKETLDEGRPRVLFGVRPCDARSVMLNGLAYEEDPYYMANVERTLLVGVSCREQCGTCFCRWVGGSPFGTEGLDILLIETEQNFVAEALTDRGVSLVEAGGGAREASGEDLAMVESMRQEAEQAMSAMPDTAETLRSKDLMSMYNADFWGGLSESCINCGACTFLCPTCYCFDIQDEVVRKKGRRIRYWDSCMFPLFTQHASGHNPRGQKVQRVRNRFMHKLKYFPDRFGPVSCVGCGRCIRECPVNIDIREVLRDLLGVE